MQLNRDEKSKCPYFIQVFPHSGQESLKVGDRLIVVEVDEDVTDLHFGRCTSYKLVRSLLEENTEPKGPKPIVVHCPECGLQHIDAPEPETGWTNPPHKSHLCHGCGTKWRPADFPTNGVERTETRGENDTWPHEHSFAGREGGYRCTCGVVRPDRDDLPPDSPRRAGG